MVQRAGIGPKATFTDEQLALFAEYRPHRAAARPAKCDGGERCWVERGPAAIDGESCCVGCGGRPRVRMELSP